ncbi:hypothetical protein [Clostridium sp. ZS2]|nr:hypothetical protein [Clostridium sp. ZS2]
MGKLLVPITDDDLIQMLKNKEEGLNPEDTLFEIVDTILLTLAK